MTELKSLFEAYGADYDATMTCFTGNEAMYLKILNRLFRDTNLQKSLMYRNIQSVFERVEMLRGNERRGDRA